MRDLHRKRLNDGVRRSLHHPAASGRVKAELSGHYRNTFSAAGSHFCHPQGRRLTFTVTSLAGRSGETAGCLSAAAAV